MVPHTQQELDDLYEAIMECSYLELLKALTRVNRMGELEDLLVSLGMPDLLSCDEDPIILETSKNIVLGAIQVPVDKLRSTARKEGFDSDRFEFKTEYKQLKHFDFRKIRGSMGYVAIFAGPMSHSTPSVAEASSFIARVENNLNDYPQLFRLSTKNEIKITNNSFRSALRELKKQFTRACIRYDSYKFQQERKVPHGTRHSRGSAKRAVQDHLGHRGRGARCRRWMGLQVTHPLLPLLPLHLRGSRRVR